MTKQQTPECDARECSRPATTAVGTGLYCGPCAAVKSRRRTPLNPEPLLRVIEAYSTDPTFTDLFDVAWLDAEQFIRNAIAYVPKSKRDEFSQEVRKAVLR